MENLLKDGWFINVLNKYLLSVYYELGSIVGWANNYG